jgi:glyoxylase-like metal-dependent hydrolase (beta-lactamase superfamily II)
MGRAIRIIAALLVVAAVALGVVIVTGQRGFPVPDKTDFALDVDSLRELARSRQGPLPVALDALVVARSSAPRGAMIAGQSWFETLGQVFPSYRIAYADGTSIVVDAAYFPRGEQGNDPAAVRALEDAMASASSILLTHTHADHVNALARSARYEELKSKLVLTRASLDEPNFGLRVFPKDSLRDIAPLEYQGVMPFAPGVVLIAAPGHTTDSQMIFIELADGRDYLLVGDVVWNAENIRTLTTRPRIIGNTLIRGDEAKVAPQIRALHDLMQTGKIEIVVSHDAQQLAEQIREGKLGDGFAAPPAP